MSAITVKKIAYAIAGVCLFLLIGTGAETISPAGVTLIGAIAWALYALL